MSIQIGALSVGIIARTSGLTKGLRSGRREIKSFSRSVTASLRPMTSFAGALTGIAGIGGAAGLAASLRATSDELDKIGKTSTKLGVSTEGLMGLHHAATMTGVSTNTLDMALQRMVRRVAEAAQGTGEAKGALLELGLSAQRLTALAPDMQLREIARAMGGVASQGDKVRLAMKLFDSEGVALVNTLSLGSDGLKAMARDAKALGATMSGEQAKQVAEFTDSLARLKAASGGLMRQLTIDISPLATQGINKLTDMYVQGRKRPAAHPRGSSGFTDKVLTAVTGGLYERMTGVPIGKYFDSRWFKVFRDRATEMETGRRVSEQELMSMGRSRKQALEFLAGRGRTRPVTETDIGGLLGRGIGAAGKTAATSFGGQMLGALRGLAQLRPAVGQKTMLVQPQEPRQFLRGQERATDPSLKPERKTVPTMTIRGPGIETHLERMRKVSEKSNTLLQNLIDQFRQMDPEAEKVVEFAG